MTNLIAALKRADAQKLRFQLCCVSPNDSKYADKTSPVFPYLTAEAEWRACARVQQILLETRAQFGQASEWNVAEMRRAIRKFDPRNAHLLEGKLRHDQLAVIEELGRHMSAETKALLHPGTTSYDILDTARAYLLQECWKQVFRPAAAQTIEALCTLAEEHQDRIQAGRTHLQRTSPVLFGGYLTSYARRLADRTEGLDRAFSGLRGKISGIVGTGASIDAVMGEDTSLEFEREVLKRLKLKPDYTANQIVAKERLADVGHAVVTFMHVLENLANDMRLLYSAEIAEVGSMSSRDRLGGSSADAAKDNPINWENIAGKAAVVEGGMRVCYAQMDSNLQRDLRNSVQARYEPAGMIAETYESCVRASKAIEELWVNAEAMNGNLQKVAGFPSEAMTAITRAHGWVHPEYGVGHEAVKEFSRRAKRTREPLLAVAMEDQNFAALYDHLPNRHQRILQGELGLYLGSAAERLAMNVEEARAIIRKAA